MNAIDMDLAGKTRVPAMSDNTPAEMRRDLLEVAINLLTTVYESPAIASDTFYRRRIEMLVRRSQEVTGHSELPIDPGEPKP